MSKLLRVNFRHLFRMKSFYFAIAIMIYCPIMSCISDYMEMTEYGYVHSIEESIWQFGVSYAFIVPVLVHLFIGPDYVDKTIRNKLIIGYGKKDIFMANMITMMVACLILFFVWNIFFWAIGSNMLVVESPIGMHIVITLEELLAVLFLTALLVLLAMFMSGKVTAGVLSMILALCIIASGLIIKRDLAEEEFEDSNVVWAIFEEGAAPVQKSEKVPNPRYIPEGPRKEALRYLERVDVGAQLLDVTDNHEIDCIWYFAFDSIMILLICAGGSAMYKRKDIF